jgi:hypothetical protein
MSKSSGKAIAAKGDRMPELGGDFFRRAVRGKYFSRMMAKSNIVRIAPDLIEDFPNESAVNEALRAYRQLRIAFEQVARPSRGRTRKSA